MQGHGAVQRRLQAFQQHLTATSFDTEKAPHLSMDATAAQSSSVWQQIPQVVVVPLSHTFTIVSLPGLHRLILHTGSGHMTLKADRVIR